MELLFGEVQGAKELFDWFGYWPSFHDAEVLSLELRRSGESELKLSAFEMTKDVDANGYFVLAKQVVVSFFLADIQALHLDDFNRQNVIFGLLIQKVNDRFELTLDGCYGLQGVIAANGLRISFMPGKL